MSKDRLTRLDDDERVLILRGLLQLAFRLEDQRPVDWDAISRVYKVSLIVGTKRKGKVPKLEGAWLGFEVLRMGHPSISSEITGMIEGLRQVRPDVEASTPGQEGEINLEGGHILSSRSSAPNVNDEPKGRTDST